MRLHYLQKKKKKKKICLDCFDLAHFWIISALKVCTDTSTVMDMPKFSREHIHDVFLIFPEKGFDISCKLKQFARNAKNIFFWKKIRKKIKMSSAENFTLISVLKHSTLNKNYSRRHFEIIFIFLPENRFWDFSQIVSRRQFAWKTSKPVL